jgi:tetratricopeptide (TPR) repeat protein
MSDSAIAEPTTGTLQQGLDAARATGDLAVALALFGDLRRRFPDSHEPFQQAAFALLEATRYDEADALLEVAKQRFPDNANVAVDYAWVAHRRHAVAEAVARWDAVREAFPGHPTGYIGAAVTLREAGQMDAAQALLTQAESRFSGELSLVVEQAWMANARRDLPASIERWAEVRRRMPDFWIGYTGGGAALSDAQRFDEADAVLTEATARFPLAPQPSIEYAQLAVVRLDWPEAHRRWQRVADRFPDQVDAYTGQAQALRELRRLPEAEIALRLATERFPHRVEILIELAWSVTHQNRPPEAIALWETIRTRFPGHVGGYNGGAVALSNAGKLDEAGALLEQAMTRFPDNPGPPMEGGWIALNTRNFSEAERIFTWVRERFHDRPAAELGLGRALRAQGRRDEAEAILRAAVARFPAFGLLAGELADLIGKVAEPPPAPAPAEPVVAPAPVVRGPVPIRTGPLRIAVTGFHLSNQIVQILSRLAPLRGKLHVERLDVGSTVDTIQGRLPTNWLEGADIYFEETMVGSTQVKSGLRALLPAYCAIRTFATSGCQSLWPFRGRDDRMVPEPPIYNGGRYSHTDPIAASLAGTAMTDDALFDAYMELTEDAAYDLDRGYANDLAQWQRDDAACDVKLATFIDARFRNERLFATPHERLTPIVRETVRQLLETPELAGLADAGALNAALDRLLLNWRASHQGLPVHPRVGQHFGLSWWSPDMRYRMLGNDFTFRDYIVRYIRWSPWLP